MVSTRTTGDSDVPQLRGIKRNLLDITDDLALIDVPQRRLSTASQNAGVGDSVGGSGKHDDTDGAYSMKSGNDGDNDAGHGGDVNEGVADGGKFGGVGGVGSVNEGGKFVTSLDFGVAAQALSQAGSLGLSTSDSSYVTGSHAQNSQDGYSHVNPQLSSNSQINPQLSHPSSSLSHSQINPQLSQEQISGLNSQIDSQIDSQMNSSHDLDDSKKWGLLPVKQKQAQKYKSKDNSTSIISHRIDNDRKTKADAENHYSHLTTSIISHKIDEKPKQLENDFIAPSLNLTEEIDSIESLNSTPQPEDDSSKTKRKYKIDRNNIRINKRIMSKDTEDVIKMFKKFDNEVLTNAEAKSRLLSLGFETRKRYITTFKHYIRFCCKKGLDNFFVTGELMKEFYEEQFTKSNSDKPVIRLRKMDPAFSKLQEINFLVYHLPTKEIPNRHVALEYLIFKETGVAISKKKKNKYEINSFHESSIPSPPFSQDDSGESSKRRKKSANKDDTINHIKNTFSVTRKNIDSIVREKLQLLHNTDMNNLVDTINSLLTGIYGQLDTFNDSISEPPAKSEKSTNSKSKTKAEKTEKVPKIGMNHDIFTIYQILEEWRVEEPTIEFRLEHYGTDWIVDEVDLQTFNDRKLIVGFVDRISEECNEPDKFIIANDCDKYIRDKSILDEFISEIELDQDDLFKRILRYRQKRS